MNIQLPLNNFSEEDLIEILKLFLIDSKEVITHIENSYKKDEETIKFYAHKITGTLMLLNMRTLGSLSEQIEAQNQDFTKEDWNNVDAFLEQLKNINTEIEEWLKKKTDG